MYQPICVKPIGYVIEGLSRERRERGGTTRYRIVSKIRLLDEYAEGLTGLEEYSHAIIVYWMHEAPPPRLKGRPWGEESLPEVGVFATRFPSRPNPIGVSVVEVVGVEKPMLLVRGLDAWSGTPVLDIKPYDYYDVVCEPRVPHWLARKWDEWSRRHRYSEVAPWMYPCR